MQLKQIFLQSKVAHYYLVACWDVGAILGGLRFVYISEDGDSEA